MLICPHCGHRPGQPSAIDPARPLSLYAGFWLRTGAFLLDAFIMLPVGWFLVAELPAGNLVMLWLYFAFLESSAWQGSIGKRVLRLRVTDVNGERLSFKHASGRFFSKFLSSATAGLGFLLVAWTRHKQGLHDLVSSTLVLR